MQPDKPREGVLRPLREGETETELSAVWRERASELGVVMHRPQWSPNTMLAHEATAYAREKGLDGQLHHVLAKAYWESGADLGDLTVVQELAQACGLDWTELGPRLESGYYRQQVLEGHEKAKEAGVTGTPTYQVEAGEPAFGNLSIDDLRGLIIG